MSQRRSPCGEQSVEVVTRNGLGDIGGRVLTVEPDNSARYWYTSVPSGTRMSGPGTLVNQPIESTVQLWIRIWQAQLIARGR